MEVLEDQREGSFSEVGFTRLANSARRRIGPNDL